MIRLHGLILAAAPTGGSRDSLGQTDSQHGRRARKCFWAPAGLETQGPGPRSSWAPWLPLCWRNPDTALGRNRYNHRAPLPWQGWLWTRQKWVLSFPTLRK